MTPPRKPTRKHGGATTLSLVLVTTIVALAFLHLGRGAVEARDARRERERVHVRETLRDIASDRLEEVAARLERGAFSPRAETESLSPEHEPLPAPAGLPVTGASLTIERHPPAGISGLWWASVTATWSDTRTGERHVESVETHGHVRTPASKG